MIDGLISIIVPVYNGQEYLKETVNRILESEYTMLEVILVDDGSGEECFKLCDTLANKDNRIHVFHKENGGIADARNFGMIHSEGEFICFCDQDDIVSKYAYEKMIGAMKDTGADICISSDCYYDKGKIYPAYPVKYSASLNGDEIRKNVLLPLLMKIQSPYEKDSLIFGKAHLGTNMFRRSLIENNDIKFHYFIDYEDDMLFVLDSYMKCDKMAAITDVTYYWRINPDSESNSGKYYRDFYKNSMRLERYVDQYAKQLPIDDESYLQNRRKRIGLALCANLDNECRKGNPKTIRAIYKELKQVYGRAKTQRILSTMDTYKTEKRYIMMSKLLGMGYIRSAYWINCFLLRYLLPIWVWLKRIKER